MSVTTPIFTFFLAGVDAPPPLPELPSSSPQAATATAPRASIATSIKRIRVCLNCSLLRAPVPVGGSLDQCEQPHPDVLLDEGRAQRRAGDLAQRVLPQPEVLGRDRVLASD